MLESDKTFQVPAEVLTGIRRYYKAVEVLHEEFQGRIIPADYFVKRIKQEHTSLTEKVLPRIKVEQEDLKAVLKKLNIEVGEV